MARNLALVWRCSLGSVKGCSGCRDLYVDENLDEMVAAANDFVNAVGIETEIVP